MKIYFAGSITGGRDDAALYEQIIQELGQYGQVLTEHLGLKTLTSYGEAKSAEEIYTRDVLWVREADVLVAEVTQPSLGVGYELGLAESLGKKSFMFISGPRRKTVIRHGQRKRVVCHA